nr:immunoglobulin light chain junction region [Macaca mulatta]
CQQHYSYAPFSF